MLSTIYYLLALLLIKSSTNAQLNTLPKPVVKADQKLFGPFIEGATFFNGSILAVDPFDPTSKTELKNGIGAVDVKDGITRLFLRGAPQAQLNGLRIVDGGTKLLAADPAKHVLFVHPITNDGVATQPSSVISIPSSVGVPNDVTDTVGGGVYVSGGKFQPVGAAKDGEVWFVPLAERAQPVKLLTLGRTNGIALSKDKKTLFVTENVAQRNKIQSFQVQTDGSLKDQKLVVDFDPATNKGFTADSDLDGLRVHPVSGNLFVAHTGNGKSVVEVNPADGNIVRTIGVSMNNPTNLDFSPAGDKLFVVGRCGNAPFGQGNGCLDVASL
ncbi:uncharacterized protein SPPG_03340 [Spizellomyces punctatus DAOM BR117]|uniref:SMP-30/Gluconolactonase/LRE-like region domain-containing protein n=1 Tax=Spizellomyces punctatus (strain DAOM BR117) TaxID=645134 RepID=A0A0L0HL28_SPIPD|nr:uncharacterized protein SPPG_03340 [Spizellomyces punctatus DAOM BR117]KND01539.1 hypothetical protein SPPG_03340 [Spizellomyces punctatus DAOM BR117]|eukprot:XP_016609578.1 hypothetical protein SPPG_03340 [Spizellomyces punctatus DAOM BR117]